MRRFCHVLAGIAIILAILACNIPSSNPNQQDPGAIMTAAALTVQAQLPVSIPSVPVTAPSAIPPTVAFTSIPLPTVPIPTLPPPATPTSNCDNAQFITDVSYPDNTVVPSGATFTKTWRLKNIGSCSWTPSYALVFSGSESMGGPAAQALTGNVNPGQTVDISVNLTGPSSNGTHTGNWGLRNAAGVIFAHFYVQIKVSDGSGGGIFAVTSVSFSVTKTCPTFNLSVTITTNGAGTVKLHRIWNDAGTDSTPKTLVFSGAGSQTIDYGGVTSPSGSWTDIYIDSPNHQQFGLANFVCP